MHLIYARFVQMALKDFGLVAHPEPFQRLVHQGTITNRGAKMSKSKGNVVSPDAFVDRYGADVFRMYLMFMGPFTEGGDWSDRGITGIHRFAKRLLAFLTDPARTGRTRESPAVTKALHALVKKVTEDIGRFHFNTAISSLMEFLHTLEEVGSCTTRTAETVCKLLCPLAPHLSEEVWESLGHQTFVSLQKWPTYKEALLKETQVNVVVQVNGKMRGQVTIDAEAKEEDVVCSAKAHENVRKHIDGKEVRNVIYVQGKILNLVT